MTQFLWASVGDSQNRRACFAARIAVGLREGKRRRCVRHRRLRGSREFQRIPLRHDIHDRGDRGCRLRNGAGALHVVGTINAGRIGAQIFPGVTQTYAIKRQVRLPGVCNGRYRMSVGGGLNATFPARQPSAVHDHHRRLRS
jgi:hypothetical protein